MTEEEGDLLFEVKEEYWHAFKTLVRNTLNKVPESLEHELRDMLQDASSVWHCGIPDRGESDDQS